METFPDNPFELFQKWFSLASQHESHDPHAMVLATINEQGQPSTRVVLLKELKPEGFIFYTNLGSQKARDIAHNPFVSLCFYWKSLRYQIRIQGTATLISACEADAYFATRPLGSQIAAWASKQSQVLTEREKLETEVAAYALQFGDGPVLRPPFWSGFCVHPESIECWQNRPYRLHERLIYQLSSDQTWIKKWLYP